jgi:hypothetical protein
MKTEQERQEIIDAINTILKHSYDSTLDEIHALLKRIEIEEDVKDLRVCHAAKSDINNRLVNLRAITYSMDLLIPGFYFWCPYFTIRIGGAIPDDNPYKYPGKIHSPTGFGIVLPGYKIFTSYQGHYNA